ncbi:MAG: ABC transporter permease [Saccharofermentans sp.]|nr:ABC transporter permease [Saccharofermentans sp.]
MSIRAFWNSVREGFKGITRHPLVTIASITTILLMLIVMSAFFIFSANVRSVMRKLSQEPPIEVYMKLQVSEDELNATALAINNDPDIISYSVQNPEENYNYFKNNLGSSASILDDFDYNMYLPYTFNVQISDPALAQDVVNRLNILPGVSKVSQESNVMHFLTRAKNIVNLATVVAFIVLFIIALFIISNMVRISVYSRASEIEIMKFVGATNAYIRLPYVIEGAMVGLISALCAWGISVLAYRTLFYEVMEGVDLNSFYALIPAGKVMWWVLIIASVIGILIGAIGSGISVRKYIKV